MTNRPSLIAENVSERRTMPPKIQGYNYGTIYTIITFQVEKKN